MQRFKSIIVSSAVALALTAANLSAQQGPAVPGSGSGGGGDASAANQAAQIALETKIATSLVAIATGTDGMKTMTANIATSNVAIATGMNALVQILQYTDGLEGLVTSGNALLTNISTSAVTIGTGINRMQAVHADIATSVNFSAIQALRIATSNVAIATGIDASKELLLRIATSVVKSANTGASNDTELSAAATPANGSTPPLTSHVWNYNLIYRSDQGRWYYGEAASSSTGVADAGTGRVIEASNSPVATAAVETASRQAQIATSVVAISDRFPDRVIGCTNQATIATTATNYRQVIPAGTGQIIYVCTELWTVTQAALVSFGYGGGTNCDSGPVALTGEMSIAASSGASRGSGLGMLYQIPAGKAFCVRIATASGGAAIGGTVGYVRR